MRAPPFPDFRFPLRHPDSETAEAIEKKISSLQNERERFLSQIAKLVGSDRRLQDAFDKALQSTGGTELWSVIRAKMSGGDDRAIIKAKSEARGVPHLIHFTRVENLPSIMKRGLWPVSRLVDNEEIEFHRNDYQRWDRYPDANCLSIAHPNSRMFCKYRLSVPEQKQDWAVLVLDKSVLWTTDAAFCRHNAADNRMRKTPLDQLKRGEAFDAMFERLDGQTSRDLEFLASYDPPDVQAEIPVFEDLSPKLITEGTFMNERNLVGRI